MTKILIVEDESIIAADISRNLKKMGYDIVSIVASGEKALIEIEKNQPDLVLMDIMLQGKLDGIQTTEIIHSRFDIPVVFLTAYSSDGIFEKAKTTEPFGYIIKPYNIRELNINIEIAIYKHNVEKKLKDSKLWLDATIDSLGEAIISSDENGIIKTMNILAEAMTGWNKFEALGKPLTTVFNVVNKVSGKTAENPILKAIKEELFYGLDDNTVLIKKDGTEMSVDIIGSVVRDSRKKIIGVVIVFYDIMERKQLEAMHVENMGWTYKNKSMSDFLVIMGYELQTSLNSIINLCNHLKKFSDKLNEEQKHSVNNILMGGKDINKYIDNIIYMSSIESGKIELSIEKFNVSDAINEVINDINADVVLEFDPNFKFIEADRQKFKQIFFNIINYYLRFNKENNKNITVIAKKCDDNGEFSISYKGDWKTKTIHDNESGLGLAISKKFIELHGGKIFDNSNSEIGSNFVFLLPIGIK